MGDSRTLWHNRDYLLLWSGQIISSLGTQLSQLAFPLLVLALTKSPAQAGIVGTLRALPYIVLSLPAGALVDRWNRKKIMVYCDTGRALCMLSIPLAAVFGHMTLFQIYGVALCEGSLAVFFSLASAASLTNVVSKAQLPEAMGRYQATEGVTLLTGPLLGGILYSITHVLPFFMDAISYIISAISLCCITTSFQKERLTATPKHIGIDIMEGLIWLWQQPLILFLAVLSGGVNIFLASFPLIVIVLAQQQHASPFTIGVIFAIGGCGGIVGALFGGFIKKRFRFGQVIGGILWLWVIFWALYLVISNLIVLSIIATIFFFSEPVYNVVQFSHRLSLIPDQLQGRVNSAFRLIAFSGPPLGLALTGMLLQTIHALPTILVFLGGLMILALVTTLSPHMRMIPGNSKDHVRPINHYKK